MAKVDTTVGELVGMIAQGKLRLPELQRRYVWPATRVRDLLDSLYRGYPSGTILVWQSDEAPEHEMAIKQTAHPGYGDRMLLLDGQQRLTSLFAVIRGQPLHVKNRVKPVEIAFNLEHPEGPPVEVMEVEGDMPEAASPTSDVDVEENGTVEETADGPSVQENIRNRTFVVASQAVLADPHWLLVSDVFDESKSDYQLLKPLGIMPDEPLYDKYAKRIQRVRAIKKYLYVMHVLEPDLSYEEVAEIFVRVNSLGMKLRGSDLALAQITARWPKSLQRFETFQAECESHWFALDLGVLVRCLVVFATRHPRFATAGRIPVATLERAWEQTQQGLRFAIDFLRQDAGIETDGQLSSPYFLIVMAVLAVLRQQHLTEDERRDLLHWVFVANATAHYTTSSETKLDADLALLHRGRGIRDLLQVVEQESGRLRFTARDFARRSVRHPLLNTAYLALRHSGAKDWGTGLTISMTHEGRWHWIEAHPLFPTAVLTQAGYDKADINEIANLVFVKAAKFRRLGRQKPEEYLPSLVDAEGVDVLRRHCIPTSHDLWRVERFGDFLAERRTLMAQAVNAFLDQIASGTKPEVDPTTLIEAGESESVEFKPALCSPNDWLEKQVVKAISGFLNTGGGTLFIGVDDHGVALGLATDMAEVQKHNVDGFERRLRDLVSGRLGTMANGRLEVRFPVVDELTVCMVRVGPASEPVYTKEGQDRRFYARFGNQTRSLDIPDTHKYIQQHFR